jgi:hypothetical protein
MSRGIGHPKTGGRKKGTPNKRTLEFRERIFELGLDPLEQLCAHLKSESLNESEKVKILLDLLPYLYAKRKPLDIPESTTPSDAPIEYVAIWGSGSSR